MTDIGGLRVAEVSTLKLKHPLTGDELEGAEVDLVGHDSAKFRAMVHTDARKIIGGEKSDPAETEAVLFRRCCELTVAIRGITADGKPITEAEELYRDYPWAYEQAQAFILRRANFMKPA